MIRGDGRDSRELRECTITPGYQQFAEGSVLIQTGQTKVLCAVSVEERVPAFMKGQGRGWITAEYGMLPRSTLSRISRERAMNGGRTHEIQRLIGRSLRSVADLAKIGERTLTIDCDVLQADGGTRTAAITGAYVALYQALLALVRKGVLHHVPLTTEVAATSVGLIEDQIMLDLSYDEDFRASVDFNVVMTGEREFVELQGTGEEHPFSRSALDDILSAAETGIVKLIAAQREVIKSL